MPVTSYATIQQFADRLPATAWGSRTQADALRAIATASSMMDDHFRGRWDLPFAAVGLSVSEYCVDIARNLFMGGRGFTPVSGADQDLIAGLAAAAVWLDKVQRRVLFPDVTLINAPPDLQQPVTLSSSAINPYGSQRAPTRGW